MQVCHAYATIDVVVAVHPYKGYGTTIQLVVTSLTIQLSCGHLAICYLICGQPYSVISGVPFWCQGLWCRRCFCILDFLIFF